MCQEITKDMKIEMKMKTTHSRPVMVFKIHVTKGTKSFHLKYHFFSENGAFRFFTLERSMHWFLFNFLQWERSKRHAGGKCWTSQSRIC